jgi:hypothetical protein
MYGKYMATETNNSNLKCQPPSLLNNVGHKVLQYDSPASVLLDLPFIMTCSKKLNRNMPYMLSEGSHTKAVRLLAVHDADGVVYLNVQELLTDKTYTLTWNMEYIGDYWLWSLADFETLTDLPYKNE